MTLFYGVGYYVQRRRYRMDEIKSIYKISKVCVVNRERIVEI